MSYTPTEWKTGDIVSSQRLNKLEEGVANAGTLTVHLNQGSESSASALVMDKTYQEIFDAFPNVVLELEDGERRIPIIYVDEYKVLAAYYEPGQPVNITYEYYTTDSMSGYPEWHPQD